MTISAITLFQLIWSFMTWILLFISGYIVGVTTSKPKREVKLSKDKAMDELRDTMLDLVLDAKAKNIRLSITENRNGSIVSCENLETHDKCSISKIE